MVPKLISKSIAGILILVAVAAAMVWQVSPASAGFTPTPPPTETLIPPTETPIPPTGTPIPPTGTPHKHSTAVPTATPATTPATTPTPTPPPLLPRTGGQASGPNNIEVSTISLAAMLVLLVTAISLVIRKSVRAKSG